MLPVVGTQPCRLLFEIQGPLRKHVAMVQLLVQ
jgi:hypothetical protein